MDETQVMVPGILVALKTSVRGGVEYHQIPLEEDDEGRVKKWETTRLMDDPAERKAAGELSAKASSLVSKLCVRTSFGMLCRIDKERELDAAVAEMRTLVRAWNSEARHSFVYASAIKGRIADNDEEALRAILDEAKDLLDQMDRGLSESDVEMIRGAAMRAKRLSEMMTEDPAGQISAALTAARSAARAIVKRSADMSNELAATTLTVKKQAFDEARFSFLEMSAEVAEALPSIDMQRTAELEVPELQEVG